MARRLNQYGATTYGRIPSAATLDQIIQSELDAAQNSEARNRILAGNQSLVDLQRTSAANQDAFNSSQLAIARENQQLQDEANEAAKDQGIVTTAAQLGTTAAALAGKDAIIGAAKGAGGLVKDAAIGAYNLGSAATGLYDSIASAVPEGFAAIESIAPVLQSATGATGITGISGGVTPTIAGNGVVQTITNTAPSVSNAIPSAADKAVETGALVTDLAANAAPAVSAEFGITGADIAGAIGSEIASVTTPVAIVGAANILRDMYGDTGKDYSEKSGRARFFDDPGLGLGANIAGAVFGDESKVASIPMAVGEEFSHYAGGPISKAFSGHLTDAAAELGHAPETTMDRIGVDDTTANIISNVINPPGQLFEDIGNHDYGDAAASLLTGGVYSVIQSLCFAAGTPISMDGGSAKTVEDVDLLDECEGGGMVNGKGVVLANDLYDYEGIGVTGSHAVYEDGEWKRVKDSLKGKYIDTDEPVKVYILNNENHILMVNGIRFADFGEVTNSEDMTDQQRLDYLNEHCRI